MEQRNSSLFKVFIGSPGDVAELRQAAFEIIQGLSGDDWRPEGLEVEGYGWDVTHYPQLANSPPQCNIDDRLPQMEEYDVCLFIIGSRLGTPLDGENYPPLADGRQPTGTEHEFHQAMKAGRPVLLYHYEQSLTIDPKATPEAQMEALQQYQQARAFIKAVTQDDAGHFVGDKFAFSTAEAFRERLQKDLKKLVLDRLPEDKSPLKAKKAKAELAAVPQAYLHWLKKQLPDLNLKGLRPKTAYPARLPDIYVPALVMARRQEEAEQKGLQGHERENLELLLARLERESLYVSGAPGSGKTTFSHWLCWLFGEGRLLSHAIEAPDEYREALPTDLLQRLPILCRLRDFWGHMECQKDNGNWTQQQLEQALARWLETKGVQGISGDAFLQWLQAGRCLLIFDGFDEVPERH